MAAIVWKNTRLGIALSNALGVNRSARLTAVNTKEHQVLNENLDAQSHKVHRLDTHTVVKNDVSVFLDSYRLRLFDTSLSINLSPSANGRF